MIYVSRGRNPVSCVLTVHVSLVVASARWIPCPCCLCSYCIVPTYSTQKSKILDSMFVSFWLAIVVSLFVLQLCFAFCSAFVLQRLQLVFAPCFSLRDGYLPILSRRTFELSWRLWLVVRALPCDGNPSNLSCTLRLWFAYWLACDIYLLLVLRL